MKTEENRYNNPLGIICNPGKLEKILAYSTGGTVYLIRKIEEKIRDIPRLYPRLTEDNSI
ncbi:hypothetical protein COV15_00285 [Candidatus Woesearchaeota archaeon CG10_big_fil_rev_8_21_14_0_10_34_12]|nr:MAG: hypothetical protein COV15_00285 [Candidatus Woesearchaeota archaeon CG10_big_fil_rev_8_21_14_0_10_34_12]